MHDGSGFDFKSIIASLADYFEDYDLKVLGESTEKLSSISIKSFNKTGITVRFIDSKKHLNESLDSLTKSLSNNFHDKNNCEYKCNDSLIYYYRKAYRCDKCNTKVKDDILKEIDQ